MKKKWVCLILAAAMTVTMTSCLGSTQQTTQTPSSAQANGATESQTQSEVIEIPKPDAKSGAKIIRFASNLTTSEYGISPTGIALKCIVDEVNEKSGGKMLIDLYPGSQLASKNDQIIGGLQTGAFEMTNHATGNWGDYTSAFAALNVPYLYKSNEVVHEILDGIVGGHMAEKCLEDTGATILGYIEIGMRHMTNSKKEIRSPKDIAGLKMRVMSDPIQIAAMEALGGSVVSVAYSELFTALQQRLVDGQENPLNNINSQKFYEVQKYLTLTGHGITESVIVINHDYFESLTEEEQKILKEACEDATKASRTACQEQQDSLLEKMKEKGMQVAELENDEKQQFIDAVKGSWTLVEENMGKEAYDELLSEVDRIEKQLNLQ